MIKTFFKYITNILFAICISSIYMILETKEIDTLNNIIGFIAIIFISKTIIGEFASLANTHCQHSTIQTC